MLVAQSMLVGLITGAYPTISKYVTLKNIEDAKNSLALSNPATLDQMYSSMAENGGNKDAIQQLKTDISNRQLALAAMPSGLPVAKKLELMPLVQRKMELLTQMSKGIFPDHAAIGEIERIDRKLNEAAGVPLTNDEQLTLEELRKRSKEKVDGKLKKPLTPTEKDLLSHLEARVKNKADEGLNKVADQESVGGKGTAGTEEGGGTTQKTDAGKQAPTKVGNVTIGEHGEDVFTAQGVENGTEKNDPLTADGRKEAENQGVQVANDNPNLKKVIHGTTDRVIETAKIIIDKAKDILGHPVESVLQPLLDTWNIGKAEGQGKEGSFDEQAWADKPDEAPEGGESFNSFAERAKKAWEYLKTQGDDAHAVASSKMERMLSSLNESDGDLDKAKEIYFRKLAEQKSQENAIKEGNEQGGNQQQHQNGSESGQTAETSSGDSLQQGGEGKEVTGTKNAINDELRKKLGLKPLDLPKRRSNEANLAEGKRLVDSGEVNPMDIVNELLTHADDPYKAKISPQDEYVLQYHLMQLAARKRELNVQKIDIQDELKADPNNQELQDQFATVSQDIQNNLDLSQKSSDANKIGGRVWHEFGMVRQMAVNELGQVERTIESIKTAYGDKVPAEVQKQLNDLQLKYDELVAKNEKIEAQLKREMAKREVDNAVKSEAKKKATRESLNLQKDQAINNIKDKVSKLAAKLAESSGGKMNLVEDNEDTRKLLTSISSDIGTLVSVYAKQGILDLDEIIGKIHTDIKGLADISKDNIRDIIAGRYSEKKPLSELQKQINDLRAEARTRSKIEDLENGIAQEVKRNEKSEKAAKLQKELDEAKKQATNEFPELSAKELAKKAESIQRQIDKGEFLKIPFERAKFEKNPEWIKNNQEKMKVMQKLRDLQADALDSQKNKVMRAMDIANQWSKKGLFLMSQAYQLKMASTTLSALVSRPIEEGLGVGFSKALPNIAKAGLIEGAGTYNVRSLGKFYTEYFNPIKLAKGTRDIAFTKSGETELEKRLETGPREGHIPVVDLLTTDPHRIIKDPLKRAVFESEMVKILDRYQSEGMDPNEQSLLSTAESTAYLRAKSEIFMSSGLDQEGKLKNAGVIDKINKHFNELEKAGIIQASLPGLSNKIGGTVSYGAASLWHFLNPIVGVSTNILNRVWGANPISYLTSIGSAIMKNKDIEKGVLSLSQNEADMIIKNLKQGAIGSAFWLLGAFGVGANAGGLYSKFKNKDENQKSNTLNVLDNEIPKDAQHSTQIQAMQVGATWRIVYDHYTKKGDSAPMAALISTMATLGAYADMEPIISEGGLLYEAFKSKQGLDKFKKAMERRVGIDKADKIMIKLGLKSEKKDDQKSIIMP
jgi:broad specificity phosphatase PhoE